MHKFTNIAQQATDNERTNEPSNQLDGRLVFVHERSTSMYDYVCMYVTMQNVLNKQIVINKNICKLTFKQTNVADGRTDR